jgi:ceramide glucosyltransferase
MTAPLWMTWFGIALCAAAAVYSLAAAIAVRVRIKAKTHRDGAARTPPAVSILKPLCGDEHKLYECLRSFFEQDYARFEIVFGVSDGDDPAALVVARLKREFPHVEAKLIVDRRQHGSSRKVSNLMNMLPYAHHDYLVISDSDVRVSRDYLAKIVLPLLDPDVGIVTCPYRGTPRNGLWSLLGSMFINDWFIPSVRVAALCGSRAFAFGVTVALRRQVLTNIGGLAAIANQLADDYRLGELTRRLGLRTILSDVVVETCVDERSFGELVRHELRWLRTIRAVRPVGYALSFVTFSVPIAWLGCAIARAAAPALMLLLVTVICRLMMHLRVRSPNSRLARDLLVLPLRDVLSLMLWAWGFVTRRVHWRDAHFHITRDGSVQPVV